MFAKICEVRLPMDTPLLMLVEKSGSVLLSLSLSLSQSATRIVATNNLLQKGDRFNVLDSLAKDTQKHLVVYGIEELSHIALQRVAGARVVTALAAKHVRNSLNAFVCAFVDAARIRISYKRRLEYFIKHRESRVMEHAVAHRGFMNPSYLRIVNPESFVWSVAIRFGFQAPIKIKDILLKILLKLSDIGLVPLVGFENFPRPEQGLGRNYRPI